MLCRPCKHYCSEALYSKYYCSEVLQTPLLLSVVTLLEIVQGLKGNTVLQLPRAARRAFLFFPFFSFPGVTVSNASSCGGTAGPVQVRKGDSIGEFLRAVQQQLSVEFREVRTASVENLIYVKEDLIIPHVSVQKQFRHNSVL